MDISLVHRTMLIFLLGILDGMSFLEYIWDGFLVVWYIFEAFGQRQVDRANKTQITKSSDVDYFNKL